MTEDEVKKYRDKYCKTCVGSEGLCNYYADMFYNAPFCNEATKLIKKDKEK